MLIVTDINGQSESLTGFTKLIRKRRVNGERTIRFRLFSLSQNEHAYPLVQEESIIELDGEEYRIKHVKETLKGKSMVKEVEANHTFFDLINSRIYTYISGSKSLSKVLDFIFAGTDYTYSIIGNYSNNTWEKFGGDNRLSLLQDVLKSYNVEFERNGTHLTFKGEIGSKLDVQFRFRHNIKAIKHETESNDLSTYIKGYGKDGLEVEYLSPLHEKYGILEAPEVRDERYTIADSLLERIKNEITDTPNVFITVDYLDLRRNGYPYEVVNEGDYILLIHERLGLDLDARIVEVEEEFNLMLEPINTKVTLSNYSNSTSDDFLEFSKTQKEVKSILDGTKKLPYNVLDDQVQRSTEALLSAQTEVEFDNGIIARSKDNPNLLVILNSKGIGISKDGGQTFTEAITTDGFNLSAGAIGYLLADYIRGGTLLLGGLGNVNGKFQVLDESGELIADLDADRGGFSDLYVANLTSPTVVARNDTDKNYYVNTNIGSDDNDGSASNPFRTVSAALNKIARYNEALITIDVAGHTSERIIISGYIGGGRIVINFNTYRLDGTIRTTSNSNQIEVNQGRFNNPSYETSATVYSSKDSYVSYRDCRWFGQNVVDYGIHALNGSQVIVEACEFNNIKEQAIRAERAGQVIVKECTGESKYGLVTTDGGLISGGGTAPLGTVSNTYETYGGQITGHFTYPVITPPPPPPAPSTTNTWNSTGGDSWRDNFGGQWFSTGYGENAVVQGYYGGYGIYRGLWLFGTSPSTAVTGKTIKSMRLYVKRKTSGGRSGDVTCYFQPHSYTSRPTGVPSFGSPSTQSSYKWGEGKWINIPSSFFAGFQSGSYKGIGIYINSTNSANYAKFFTDAKLEITYE